MATFTPPAIQDVPAILPDDRNSMGARLMKFYPQRFRGVNVFKMSDDTYTTIEPYPAIPLNLVTNGALTHSWYNSTLTITPVPEPHVVKVYYGGHSYTISATEASLLTTAGFGANIT